MGIIYYTWTRDPDFNYDSYYWMPQVGYWVEGDGWTDINQDNQNFARFETINGDHIAHLRISKINLWSPKTYVARVVQGWVWGNPSSTYSSRWPNPLSLDGIADLKLTTTITGSSVGGPIEGAVLVNVWFKINDIYIHEQDEDGKDYWVHYNTAIFGADLYFLHVGTPLYDHELRESTESNGVPVFVYTRFFQNQASGTFTIDLIDQVLLDAISQGVASFNLKDVTLYEVEAVVEEFYGFAEAWFTELRVYYAFSSGSCPTLSVFSNSTWVTEGVLDIHTGAMYNRDVIYRHAISSQPDIVKNNFYMLKLSELDEHTSYIDYVRLIAISDNGSMIELPLVMAIGEGNRPVTSLLRHSDDVWLVLRPGDEVYLLFHYNRALDESWHLIFIIEGHNPKGGY